MASKSVPLSVLRFTSDRESCMYLPDQVSRLEYEVLSGLTPEAYESRMNAGWRKFGQMLFHPVCSACTACRPIRIPVETFTPDRSQRRAIRRNSDLTIALGRPIIDRERLELYLRYHEDQTKRKGWPEQARDAEGYYATFCTGQIPAVEISVREEGILRAIVLTDLTPNVVSGVYHYHDPDLRDRSLGVFAMMQTIFLAQQTGRKWAYFGYYVAGSASLEYKARFRPCEIMGEDGEWRPFPIPIPDEGDGKGQSPLPPIDKI